MNKKNLTLILIVFLQFAIAPYVSAEPIPRQQLVKGKATSIETPYVIGDVAVSDERICDFMVPDSRAEIYLNPKEEGATTLTVWDERGVKKDVVPVEVYGADLNDLTEKLKKEFRDTNVDVKISGRRVLLVGEAESKATLEMANLVSRQRPEIENRVSMSGEVLGTIAEKVELEIGTPGIRVRGIKGRLILEGVAFSQNAVKRAIEIAHLYEPNVLNLLEVKETSRRPGLDKLVKLNVYFMEIKKETLKGLGVMWAPGSVSGGGGGKDGSGFLGGVGNLVTSLVGFVFNLVPKIRVMNEKGLARVLDSASFIVKSGEAGDFFNGTQVPYYSGDQVTFKEVGIKLHAEPIATGESVDLIINAALSSPSANIDAGIDTRTVSTSAYIKNGQSLVLANMISNRDVKTYNRKPKNIDTSSAIFDIIFSKDFQSGRSEFVVFVEPKIIEQASTAEEELKEFLELEEETVKERSKKEYKRFKRRSW